MRKHVIWDWNGTLLDDVAACVESINTLLIRRGMRPVTPREYSEMFDFPVKDYYVKLGFDFQHEDWDALAREFHDVYATVSAGTVLRRGAVPFLAELKDVGITLSILSASETGMLKRMMRERGVLDYFTHVCGLGDLYAHSKMDLGRELIGRNRQSTEGFLLIGDTTHDFDVARELAIPCLLMTGGHQSEQKLRRCGCPVVHSFDEIRRELSSETSR